MKNVCDQSQPERPLLIKKILNSAGNFVRIVLLIQSRVSTKSDINKVSTQLEVLETIIQCLEFELMD